MSKRQKSSDQVSILARLVARDARALSLFIQNTGSWVSLYLFSQHSKVTSHLPKVPSLDYLKDLLPSCQDLRRSLLSAKKAYKVKHKAFIQEQTIKQTRDFDQYQSDFNTIKKEVDLLREDIIVSCSSLQYTLDQAERVGFRRQKTRIDGLRAYVAQTKQLVISLCGAWNQLRLTKENQSIKNFDIKRNKDYHQKLVQVLLRVFYPVFIRLHSLNEQKNFYSNYTRRFFKLINEEKEQIRNLLQVEQTERSRPEKRVKVVFKVVWATIRIKNLIPAVQSVNVQGIKVCPLPERISLSIKTQSQPTPRTVSDLIGVLQKNYGKPARNRKNWNIIMQGLFRATHIKSIKRFMNDLKSIIQLLLKENMQQKQQQGQFVQKQELSSIRKLEQEKAEILSALQKTANYAKELQQELLSQRNEVSPEEFQETLIQLESHKKALKGLTFQYNQLERKHEDLAQNYQKLRDTKQIIN